jgi:hypothetical protein
VGGYAFWAARGWSPRVRAAKLFPASHAERVRQSQLVLAKASERQHTGVVQSLGRVIRSFAGHHIKGALAVNA